MNVTPLPPLLPPLEDMLYEGEEEEEGRCVKSPPFILRLYSLLYGKKSKEMHELDPNVLRGPI